MRMYLGRLIIAFGPGRCGSVSFATLMNLQRGVEFYHEFARMPWEVNLDVMERYLKVFSTYNVKVLGDFGNWYINYLDPIYEKFQDTVRFIYLHRDTDEVVRSYMNKVRRGNHWTDYDSEFRGGNEKVSHFDDCYPKYDLPKEEAIRKYCEDYHEKAREALAVYADHARSFSLSLFGDDSEQHRLFGFLGINTFDRNYCNGIHFNRGFNIKTFMESM